MHHHSPARVNKPHSPLLGRERGLALVETLIATAIVGATVVGMVMGQGGGSPSSEADLDEITSDIARAQLESVYEADYVPHPATYPSVPAPDSFTVTATTAALEGGDPNIQRIVVAVSKDGQPVLVVETYKTNR